MEDYAGKLIEPTPIEDDYCSELAFIEDVDGAAARFVLIVNQTCYEAARPIAVVKRKIILPYRAIRPCIGRAKAFLARRTVRIAGRRLLLVKG